MKFPPGCGPIKHIRKQRKHITPTRLTDDIGESPIPHTPPQGGHVAFMTALSSARACPGSSVILSFFLRDAQAALAFTTIGEPSFTMNGFGVGAATPITVFIPAVGDPFAGLEDC